MLHEHRNKMNVDIVSLIEKISLEENLGLTVREVPTKDKGVNLLLNINNQLVYIDEKYEIRPSQVNQIVKVAELYSDNIFLVASNYITPDAKQLLKEYDINYMDVAGNIRLRLKENLVFIEGKYNRPASEDYRNRAFTKVGAKLIFCFLRKPKYVNLNYRSLSEISTCSLGSISKIVDQLKEENYIITLPDGKMKLVRYQELLSKWIEVLKDQLLPSVLLGRYQFVGNRKWHEVDLTSKKGFKWGGEVAAGILTKNLRPQQHSIFTDRKERELLTILGVIPNEKGDIRIYKEFWNDGSGGLGLDHVDPILIYGELMATGDSRNIEVALEIKERYIDELI